MGISLVRLLPLYVFVGFSDSMACVWGQARVFERMCVRVRSMSHPNRREDEDLNVGNGQK